MNQQGLLWNVYYVATIVVRKQIKFSFVGEQSQISIRSYSQWHFESREITTVLNIAVDNVILKLSDACDYFARPILV